MKISSLLLNAQDFYLFMDKYTGKQDQDISKLTNIEWQLLTASFYDNKELSKVIEIAKMILKSSPDIVMLIEVGGMESLENFCSFFLKSAYTPHHFPSNSDRGIDMGYLVKKASPFHVKLSSYHKKDLGQGKKFSRGLLELKVYTKVISSIKRPYDLKCIYYLTHLKSKLDLKKQDFEGRKQRLAEVLFITNLLTQKGKLHPKTPLILAGDLNDIIYKNQTAPELQHFSRINHFDALELLNKDLKERITYFYFDRRGNRIAMQLDYCLINKKFSTKICDTSRVLDFNPFYSTSNPRTLKEKLTMPSDHLPYFLELEV